MSGAIATKDDFVKQSNELDFQNEGRILMRLPSYLFSSIAMNRGASEVSLKIDADFYQEGPPAFEFDGRGLNW